MDEDAENKYIESFGDTMLGVMEGKEIAMPDRPTDLVTIEYDDLQQIMQLVYQCGRENATENDLQKHLDKAGNLCYNLGVIQRQQVSVIA